MTIGNDLEHRLDSWMQEDATLPDELGEVLAKLPETPQRRHRWSFTLSDLTWRTRTMFSATRVAAAITIFALGAGLALIAPFGRSPQLLPGQQATSPPEPAVTVSGTGTLLRYVAFGTEATEDGIPTLRGNVSDVQAEMSDPRVSGTYRYDQSGQNHGGRGGPNWGTMTVENAEGRWEGSMIGYWDGAAEQYTWGCLVGERAYEELSYCVRLVIDTTRVSVQFDGLIYRGDPPPIDPPPSE